MRLRKWQIAALATYKKASQRDFLAIVTPGAGKTLFALQVAARRLQEGAARAIIVCPSVGIKRQWIAAAAQVGLTISEMEDWADGCHGCVTTYQQVCRQPALFSGISTDAIVILDEIHHAGDETAWGSNLQEAFDGALFRLCLTGTAFRSDEAKISFVRYENGVCQADFSYGYSESIRDGICREVVFPAFDGVMSWRSGKSKARTVSFSDVLSRREHSNRLLTALNPSGGFVREMFQKADESLRLRPRAAGLVLARDQKHALELKKVLAEVSGVDPVVATCSEGGAAAIARFRESRERWLVAVRMVAEGVDIPRCDTLVYCTNYSTDLFFRQAIGRIVRKGPGQAWCYIPSHPSFMEMVSCVQDEIRHSLSEKTLVSRKSMAGEDYDFAEVDFLGSEGELSTVIRPFEGLVPVCFLEHLASESENLRQRDRERWRNDPKRKESIAKRRLITGSRDKELEKQKERYASDPEYRSRCLEMSKAWHDAKKANDSGEVKKKGRRPATPEERELAIKRNAERSLAAYYKKKNQHQPAEKKKIAGRPRKYTPEEAAERSLERSRIYYKRLKSESTGS